MPVVCAGSDSNGGFLFLLNCHVYIVSYNTDIINVLLSEATSEGGKVYV